MKIRIRSGWLEIAAGLMTMFAALSVRVSLGPLESPTSPLSLLESALLLAACSIFLLHGLRSVRRARQACFVIASAASVSAAVWMAAVGRSEFAVMQAVLGVWFSASAMYDDAESAQAGGNGSSLNALSLYLAIAYAGLAALRFHAGTPAAVVEGLGLSVAASLLLWTERRRERRGRQLSAAVAAFVALLLAVDSFAVGFQGAGGAFVSIFAILILFIALPIGMPETSDELNGTSGRQREIYAFKKAGETVLWSVMAFSVAYAGFLDRFDYPLYFMAFLGAALVTLIFFRLTPPQALSERSYLRALLGIVLCSVILDAAAGGTSGPFMYFSYLAVFASTMIVAPVWSLATSGIYVAYVLAEAVYRFGRFGTVEASGLTARFVIDAAFLSLTLLMTGFYAMWVGRRRAATETSLLDANRRLAEALKSAVSERESSERRVEEQRRSNDDLLEMRSAIMNVLEDVEESKRQLELDRRRESASLEALGEGVIATEKDGKIFLCNPIGARLLGLEQEKVIGQTIDRVVRLFHEDGDVLDTAAFQTAFAGRAAPIAKHMMLMREDGRRMSVSGTVAPYFEEAGGLAGIVLAFRDVTVEREIDRQKSDFISIASHQLRTPLSAVRWFLDLLMGGDAGDLNTTQKEYLGDVYVSTTRMIKLVGDLLDVSRIESGKLEPKPERVAVAAFLEGITREYTPLVKSQDVHFSAEILPDATEFYADPALIHQAIGNILSNAVKYTPAGGSVSLAARRDGGMILFTIKDTGVGIPKNQQYRVFGKFFRAENVITKETVGSGLGLYVTMQIIESAGGRVSFESNEGKGTVFTVALPAKAPEGTIAA